ncbi:hypothetical protein [Kribbella sp. CA-294648]|uniref:hypothetical protein n=1 Tax=Kribbella sp. CA-294648 TaxID=3239948 RepID=UPI003D924A96
MNDETNVERLARSLPLIIVAGIADLAAFISLLTSSRVNAWVDRHPQAIAFGALTLITLLITVANVIARSNRIMRLTVISKDAEIEDLQQRLHPTPRDKELFMRLLGEFPSTTGTITFLEYSFTAKRWHRDKVHHVLAFPEVWRHEFFDDKQTQEAFTSFRANIQALGTWMASESFPSQDDPQVNELPAPHEFARGYKQFAEVRERGLRLANAVLEGRQHVERVGRSRGL